MISMDKKYRTRDGRAVRLLCTDSPYQVYPVVGLVGTEVVIWTFDGYICGDKFKRDLDLIEVNPYEDFKIDEPVMVRDVEGADWVRGHFAGLNPSGHPTTFAEGTSKWTAKDNGFIYTWVFCRRPTPEELCE